MKDLLHARLKALHLELKPAVQTFLLANFLQPKSLLQALDTLILRAHLDRLPLHKLTELHAAQILTKLLDMERKQLLTPEKIVQAVARAYGLKPDDILGKSQTQECVLPRQVAMYFCRTALKLPFIKIADHFGRDHSTVMTSVKLIQKKSEEKELSSMLEEIQRKF
jgi:chromosomal replication initiator protein